jgi:photosystem II stability/assembly factor-like uncharacterized protein
MRRQFVILIACVLLAAASCSKAPAWVALPLGTAADFRDIWFTDANHGWIAGGSYQIVDGLIGRTDDAGKTWHFTSNITPRDRMSVQALHFFDAEHGLAATDSGAILATADGGENWTPADRSGRAGGLSSLFFLDERRGWAAGHGDVLRTDDAGQTWIPLTPEGVDTNYRSLVRAIQFQDDTHGWAAGMNASLMRTADAGVTWEPAFGPAPRPAGSSDTPLAAGEHPNFWDLFFVDNQTAWVVGEEGTMLTTRDGGSTWTRQNTGLKDARSAPKLERIPTAGGVQVLDAGDRTPGFTITAVRFVDRRRGWITGFYAGLGRSLILRTEDAGATWVVDADIAGEELYTLFVQGRERLWAIGARVRPGPQSIYRRTLTK